MIKRVLVVCLGNICRSPIGEALFKHYSEKNQLGLEVMSAGIAAEVGSSADPFSVAVLAERDIDIRSHRAKQIEKKHLDWSDIILVMEHAQRHQLGLLFPQAYAKVRAIGEWRQVEVADPFGGTRQDFNETFVLLKDTVQDWLEKIG